MSADAATTEILVFALDDQRLALPLAVVDRIERAVAITVMASVPDIIAGVINVRGELIPVIALRRHLQLPERAVKLSDQFVIAHGRTRTYALLVDGVRGVESYYPEQFQPAQELAANGSSLHGAVRLIDGIVLIHDLDRFLSLDEERALDEALSHA